MEDRRNVQLRLLSFAVIAYMLMAFTWWSVLLFTKNRDAFYAKRDLIKIGMIAQGIVQTDEAFFQTEIYQTLQRRYRNQEWMILGEASVFVLSLVLGIWFINRGYHKEIVAGQTRRNFLLSITHELKSPLASIRLVLETVLKRDLDRPQLEKLGNNALKETDRLTHLVDDLLLSAKLETAYQPYREKVNLPELLMDTIQKLEEKYPHAVFQYAIQQEIPAWYGDKPGFISIALNLLENAVKYSSEKPSITIRLAYQDRPAGFILAVADEGAGIPDREKRKVFQKFYRIGHENTRKTKGTGLGLYIVDQIVRAHNGRIKVEDNHPRGTVFSLFLPES